MRIEPRQTDEQIRMQVEKLERVTFGEEEYNANYGDGRIFDLNNFYLQFPTMENEGHYRTNVNKGGWMDKPIREVDKSASELAKSQTHREFFKTLDETVEECGLSLIQLKEALSKQRYWFRKSRESIVKNHTLDEQTAWQERVHGNPTEDDKMYISSLKEQNDLLLRVYLALRQKGYSRLDLIS